jgi:phospholipid/cholesterol/gamma-HCH transport system substrate-binding protein
MNRKYIFLGAFVIISLGLLLWLAQSIGALGRKPGKHYEVHLDQAAGLVQDNAVKIAGVKVGEISKVAVGPDGDGAVLTLRVDEDVEIHEDAVALVRAKSLLGEKYLQIEPGTPGTTLLADNSEIVNVRTTFEIDQVLNALEPILGGDQSIVTVLSPLVSRVDGLLAKAAGEDGGPPIVTREELAKTLDDAQATVTAVKDIAEQNKDGIKQLIDNTNVLLSDPRIPRIIGNVDRIASTTANRLPGLLDKADSALDKADSALAKVEEVTKTLTPERIDKLGAVVDDVAVATANLRKISDDLEGIGKDAGPLISNLSILAERAASIDELLVRKFLQEEGVRIRIGDGNKNANKRIEELE